MSTIPITQAQMDALTYDQRVVLAILLLRPHDGQTVARIENTYRTLHTFGGLGSRMVGGRHARVVAAVEGLVTTGLVKPYRSRGPRGHVYALARELH